MYCWGAAYDFLHRDQHGEFCGCFSWRDGKPYRIKSREVDERGRYPLLSFSDRATFFKWFWRIYGDLPGPALFDNYRSYGCWNWVLDFEEGVFFRELFDRYIAAKELGIKPAATYDDCPIRILDGLLIIARELPAAQIQKAREDGKS